MEAAAKQQSVPPPIPPFPPFPPDKSVADRLAELEALKESGVISGPEYEAKRKRIIRHSVIA